MSEHDQPEEHTEAVEPQDAREPEPAEEPRSDVAAADGDATEPEPAEEPPAAAAEEPQADTAEEASTPEGPFPDLPITESPRTRRARSAARRRKISGVTLIVLLVVGVTVFGLLGYDAFSRRLEGARKVDSATRLIEQADVIVVQVDEVVRSEVTSSLADPARLAEVQVPQATAALEEAIQLLDDGRAGNNLDDLRRNDLLRNAAEARLQMMEEAPAILALNRGAAQALDPARLGWDRVVSADQKTDQAVQEYNKLTKAGARESSALNKQVAAELAAAKALFEQAEQFFPEGPFEDYLAYIEMRIALNQLSQQSDAAWLKGKSKQANDIISDYNARHAQAVEAARQLPATPEKAIADAFTEAARTPTEAYYKARDAATDADKALR